MDDRYDDNEIPYQPQNAIEEGALAASLSNLRFLGDDPFLHTQAFNLDMVDQFLTDLEYTVLRKLYEEERTPAEAHFLNAQSQMWIFAAYELLRTWRQRANDFIKWAQNGGLLMKLKHLEEDQRRFKHWGRSIRIEQLQVAIADQNIVDVLSRQLKHLHVPFGNLEYIRVSLAKHEVAKKRHSIALDPGYGRINRWCGSLDYAVEDGAAFYGTISRRDIADALRKLRLDEEPPTDEALASFNEFMQGISAEELDQLYRGSSDDVS